MKWKGTCSHRLIRMLVAPCVCCGMLVKSVIAAPLSAPIDVPEGPSGIEAPGGVALPGLTDRAAADAPQISAISDMTFSDETLVITGHDLDRSELVIWSEGQLKELRPDRVASDRMQACIPKGWPESTMLVWPIRDGKAGRPIRVNAATAWWCWPTRIDAADVADRELLLLGRNLGFGSRKPVVYLKGAAGGRWLEIAESDLYHIVARLPADLAAGKYELQANNGTGGTYGWSEPLSIEVIAAAPKSDRTFSVDDFGVRANDEADDTEGIQRALDDAIKAGGGIVRFSAGTYRISRTLELPEASGGRIDMVGAGMGSYDAATRSVTGGTALRFAEGLPVPKCLLHVGRRFTSIRDLTLMGGHEGILRAIHDRDAPSQVVVRIRAHDVTLQRVRLVMLDLRPSVPVAERKNLQIFDAALHLVAPGAAQIAVVGCEIHSAGSGIEIGTLQRGHTDEGQPDPSTDCVRIENCMIRGYSPGFYKEPASPGGYGTMGIFNEGIQIPNGKRVIIRGCDFAGADRRGGKMIGRSICVYNTSVRELYIAGNKSHDVGMVCPREDRVVNQGEQVLFHFRYPHGGYFDVIDAGEADVTVDPADPRNAGTIKSPHMAFDRAGSRILDEVGANDHWIVFVSAGKGVGQYRVVTGSAQKPDRTVLRVTPGWRVVPDRSSRITLTTAYRRNIIVGNTIDAGFIDPRCKVSGILFWFDAFENVIAGNRLRNLGYGAGFNSSFRNPCGWNMVRDNVMEGMGGMAVESSEPTFYFDSCRVAGGPTGPLFRKHSDDVAGWYAVGNIARSNRGHDAPCAAFLHAITTDAGSRSLPLEQIGGVMMPVLENNRFTGVKRGVVINRGAIWPVLRGNTVQTTDAASPELFDQSVSPEKAH